MTIALTACLACILYLFSTTTQFVALQRKQTPARSTLVVVGILALAAHGAFTFSVIFTDAGANIGIYPMMSVISFAVIGLFLLSFLRRPVDNLAIILFPLSALTILLAWLLDSNYQPRNDLSYGIIGHIFLSVISYGLLTIAAFQALVLAFGDYELKHRKLSVLHHMPPLQTLEALLFELIWTGLLFLSLSIATGFLFFAELVPGLIHHTVITLAAWLVFAVLLWGRHQFGWRGPIASRWTLIGFVLLVIGYFGSKVVLEIVLSSA
jgi:ABC-type uncharacterized transport system permease subunit